MAEDPDYTTYHDMAERLTTPEGTLEFVSRYSCCVACNRYAKNELLLTIRIWPLMQVLSGPAANYGIPKVLVCAECIEKTGWLVPRELAELHVALTSKDRAEDP